MKKRGSQTSICGGLHHYRLKIALLRVIVRLRNFLVQLTDSYSRMPDYKVIHITCTAARRGNCEVKLTNRRLDKVLQVTYGI